MGKKLKIGLIGTGMICSWAHVPGYEKMADDCEIVWACDLLEDKAKELAEKHGIPRVTTDYQDILKDAEIDAVSVMTPNIAHMNPLRICVGGSVMYSSIHQSSLSTKSVPPSEIGVISVCIARSAASPYFASSVS